MIHFRKIKQILNAQDTSDGDGVKIRRIGGFNLPAFSPFLMVDELKADDKKDYVGGFPPHPHRGIETLTYMMQGHFQHKDHMGNVGELRSGGAQWMAAGQGVIHSEMPIMEEGQLHGFQIWINQPARDKMNPAKYFDFQPELITEKNDSDNSLLRVISGELNANQEQLTGPLIDTGVPATLADWKVSTQDTLTLSIPATHNMMVYVYHGEISVADKKLTSGQLALLPTTPTNDNEDANHTLELSTSLAAGCLIFVGEPIDEPVVHYGPFVMNSMDEIDQAINDYQSGKFHQY